MSKKKHRGSISGSSPQSGVKYGDGNGNDRAKHYQPKSFASTSLKRRVSGGSSTPSAAFSGSHTIFSPRDKKDPWRSLSEANLAPVSTQPVPKPAPAPTPLSPPFPSTAPAAGGRRIFSATTKISTPTDPRSDPVWIAKQMAKVQKRAQEKPSFSVPVELSDDSTDSDDEAEDGEKEQTVSASKKSKKDKKDRKKKKDKVKVKGKNETQTTSKLDDKENAVRKPQVESPEAAEQRMQKNAARRKREAQKKQKQQDAVRAEALEVKAEGIQEAQRVLAASLKRKFDDPNSNVAFNSRLDAETRAIKRLRESLPGTRLTMVSQKLEQECGTEPTAMAVLVEAARETILDLARGQMNTMVGLGNGQEGISGAVLRMLTEQKDRLDKLVSAVEKPKVTEGVSETDVEKDVDVPVDEETSDSGSSSDAAGQEEDDSDDEDDSD